jgi:hypothetical protein
MNAWNRLAIAALTVALPIASAQAEGQAAGDSRSAHGAGTGSTQGMLSLQLWHATARDAIARDKPNQQAALRLLTYLAMAQQQAAQALAASAGASDSAAWDRLFDEVSARTLGGLLPAHREEVDSLAAALGRTRQATSAPERLDEVRRIAATAANDTLARATTDGFDAPWTGELPSSPQAWHSLVTPARPPHLPAMGAMQTVHLASGAALRPPAPPAVGSDAFQRALDEVRQRAGSGDKQGQARARRWEMATGALVAGYWDGVALDLASQHHLSGAEASRVLAQTLTASLDANIACHDAKYTYWTPRPSQADPRIRPLIGLPNHPSYPSNHSCDSGAAAYVLAAHFPTEASQLIAQAEEAGESRIDAGLHYRFDLDAGLQIARGAAAAALGHPVMQVAEVLP